MVLKKLLKNLKQPRHLVYKLYAVYGRHGVPVRLARLLAKGNSPALSGVIRLETPDGSGQACHPSIASFQGKTYLSCTPYPYGMDYYENPCVYVWEPARRQWAPVPGAFPAARAKQPGFEHYSDPCLFRNDDALCLLFRKCEFRQTGKADQLYLTVSSNGTDWSTPALLAEGPGDSLLSPAVDSGAAALFCVEYDGDSGTQLVQYGFHSTSELGKKTVCALSGLDPDYILWHIDVAHEPDGTLRGLFLLRARHFSHNFKLALFTRAPGENTWRWARDLPETAEEQRTIRFIYKSTFAGSEEHILCSARDQKNRLFLFEKSI